ncbi:MAG: hypothetical protein L6Q94_12825 [Calditrichia bacterium]|nr:hypothetical protein [Calditrichia bacterium]
MYPTERTELLKHISVQWYNKKGESPKDFDEIISPVDADFISSGLVSESIIRLGFLAVLPRKSIAGSIGSISPKRHKRLLKTLSDYLVQV